MALSDLQGAWQHLRKTVVEQHPFPEGEQLGSHLEVIVQFYQLLDDYAVWFVNWR
jgi:hypothetical protein